LQEPPWPTTNDQTTNDKPIWGATAIAQAAGLPNRAAAYPLLERGVLPARKLGRKWVSTPSQIRGAVTGDRGER